MVLSEVASLVDEGCQVWVGFSVRASHFGTAVVHEPKEAVVPLWPRSEAGDFKGGNDYML